MNDRMPILVGVGQCVSHWDGSDADKAPDPIGLAARASRLALEDAGPATSIAAAIDVVAATRQNVDTAPDLRAPFGRCKNVPGTIASDIGARPARSIYSIVGGEQPQALVNEFAAEIWNETAQCVLITGAEAISAEKLARKNRYKFDWSRSVDAPLEDRGPGSEWCSNYEIRNGLGPPTTTYPIFEHAYRTRLGMGRDAYRLKMAELFARFSKIAKANPYAQFQQERSEEFLATASDENFIVADPYLKWHVAQDAVNQGASVILTSVGKARELGIDKSKWVYLHGHSKLTDRFVTEREDLSSSKVISGALKRALDSSDATIDDIAFIDLYSCFPIAVFLAAEALGIDPLSRDLTVTGGLPFFGGAGNNYSLHAIASMAEKLRDHPQERGLILANGSYLTKEAAAVYSCQPPDSWAPVSCADLQQAIDDAPAPVLLSENCEIEVESFSLYYARGNPRHGFVIGSNAKGRVLARVRSGHRATLAALAAMDDPIGQKVKIVTDRERNYFLPDDRLGQDKRDTTFKREFQYANLHRNGEILEVTLNRPENHNALSSAAHFELHEIWDEFERDPDLWVAIITGAGDKAFCAGNDLKVTAKGGDMTMPRTNFAGLCSRFDREKPIICAINGTAMGGGLEIVLAADLAVADPKAIMSLPEVKVGFFAAAGGVQRLTRQIGRKAAMDMVLTGRSVRADEALQLGMINSISEPGEVMNAARALASRIIEGSPSAIRATKKALNALEESEGLEQALQSNTPIFMELMRTNDFKEGPRAFAEKRKPTWTNS